MGVTLAALVTDVRVEHVDVVEIEPLLVDWLRSGLVPDVRTVVDDPRMHVRIANVVDVLRDAPADCYQAVVLDVDNGPGFLVHPGNGRSYQQPASTDASRVLTSGGLLAV